MQPNRKPAQAMHTTLEPTPAGVGPGEAPRFMFDRCSRPKPLQGRKQQRYAGYRIWACATCAAPKQPRATARTRPTTLEVTP